MADKVKFRAKHGLEVNTLSGSTEVLVYPESDGSSGQVIKTDGSGNLSFQNDVGTEALQATGEPMGHQDRTESTISFDPSTRIFSITPIGSDFTVWCAGTKHTYTTAQTVTLPTTSGFYYIYFDDSGVLSYKTTFFTWHTDAPTAYVYYNADSTTESFFFDERHGITLDWATHEYLHRTRGAVLANGLSLSFTTLEGDGTLDTDYQVKVANGTFFDEDLEVNISHNANPSSTTDVFDQYINPTSGGGKFPVLYRAGASGLYRLSTGADVTEAPFRISSTVPQYNLNTAGTWSLANVGDKKFFGIWIVATNTVNNPVIAICGQQVHDNAVQADSNETWASLSLDGLPLVEYRPLYRLIYQYDVTFTNTGKTVLVSASDIRELGASVGAQGVVQNDHGALFGLGDDDHSQYVHIDVARTISADHVFTGDLTLAGTTINSLTMPTADGTVGQGVVTDGSGTLSFADVGDASVEDVLALSIALG